MTAFSSPCRRDPATDVTALDDRVSDLNNGCANIWEGDGGGGRDTGGRAGVSLMWAIVGTDSGSVRQCPSRKLD